MRGQRRTIFAEMNLLENAAAAAAATATATPGIPAPLKVPALYHHAQGRGLPLVASSRDNTGAGNGGGGRAERASTGGLALAPRTPAFPGQLPPPPPPTAFSELRATSPLKSPDITEKFSRHTDTKQRTSNVKYEHCTPHNGTYISQNEALYEKLKLNAEKFGMRYTLQTSLSHDSQNGWHDVETASYDAVSTSRHPILLSGMFALNDNIEPLNYVKRERVIAEMLESGRRCIKAEGDDKEEEKMGDEDEEEDDEEDDRGRYTELIGGRDVGRDVDNLSDRRTPDSDDDTCMTSSADSPRRSLLSGAATDSNKKLYNCQHCKYVTDRKNNLKRHVVTMHENCGRVLECCDHVFKNKAALRDHVSQCHKNGYDCRICGRNFCRKALLKRHVTVHSGQKDYICSICGYATSHKSNLDRHKRRHESKYQMDENLPQLHSNAHTFDLLRFLPTAFTCTPPPEPSSTHFYLPISHDDTSVIRPYLNHKTKHRNGRYIFTKRLQYTHPDNEAGDSVIALDTSSEEIDVVRVEEEEEEDEEPEMGDDDILTSSAGSDVTQMAQSSRRLAPAIYRCKDCDVVFSKQLELAVHQEARHQPVEFPSMPHRPLTLQARTRYPEQLI